MCKAKKEMFIILHHCANMCCVLSWCRMKETWIYGRLLIGCCLETSKSWNYKLWIKLFNFCGQRKKNFLIWIFIQKLKSVPKKLILTKIRTIDSLHKGDSFSLCFGVSIRRSLRPKFTSFLFSCIHRIINTTTSKLYDSFFRQMLENRILRKFITFSLLGRRSIPDLRVTQDSEANYRMHTVHVNRQRIDWALRALFMATN